MQLDDLHEEIKIELDLMSAIVNELLSLQKDVKETTPTIREKAAAGAFLAQFYGGVENILKRICKYNNVSIPSGSTWHLGKFHFLLISEIEITGFKNISSINLL